MHRRGGRFDNFRINEKDVPESKHSVFIRGLKPEVRPNEIAEFFETEIGPCNIDFYKATPQTCFVAVRFEEHEDAAKCLDAYTKSSKLFDCDIDVSWYRDIRRYVRKRKEEEREYRQRWQSRSRSRERRERSESGDENYRNKRRREDRRSEESDDDRERSRRRSHRSRSRDRSHRDHSPDRSRRHSSDMEESDGEDGLVRSSEPVIGPKRIEVNVTSTPTKFAGDAGNMPDSPFNDPTVMDISQSNGHSVSQRPMVESKFFPVGHKREELSPVPVPPVEHFPGNIPMPSAVPPPPTNHSVTPAAPATITAVPPHIYNPNISAGAGDIYGVNDFKDRVIGPYVEHIFKSLTSPELALRFKAEIFKICSEFELQNLTKQK